VAPTRPEDVGFLLACTAAPTDALPRLAWADYLDETDRSAAAAYLRGPLGFALVNAARERLQDGGDPRQTTELALWLARGGVDRMTAAAKALSRGVQTAGGAAAHAFETFVRIAAGIDPSMAIPPDREGK
jgi:uncharacterized protein (TIGR02996 family)